MWFDVSTHKSSVRHKMNEPRDTQINLTLETFETKRKDNDVADTSLYALSLSYCH